MSLTSQRFCENCGAALEPGARFCEECGTPVGAIVGKPQTPAQPQPWDDEATANQPSPPSPPSTRPWAVQVVSALLIFGIAGIGWWQRERLSGWLAADKGKPAETATSADPSRIPSAPESPAVTATDPAAPLPKIISTDMTEAQQLADLEVWLLSEPWVKTLAASMPKGVTVTLAADPFNSEGWSQVELRENHLPESGFDVDVCPLIGLFRVRREGRAIEWMEPVSGEFVPLDRFVQDRGLKIDATPTRLPSTGAAGMGVIGGDFASAAPPIPDRDSAVIVADPLEATNQVACITGPDEMSFTLPVQLDEDTPEVAVKLKVLIPEGTKLIPFLDAPGPEGIRLRVRLLNESGNSAIRDAVVRPTGQWREMEYVFYDLPKKVVQASVEAIWMEGPVYVDDVRLATP